MKTLMMRSPTGPTHENNFFSLRLHLVEWAEVVVGMREKTRKSYESII